MTAIPGRATPAATSDFITRHHSASPRRAGNLTLSSIGLGTYLGPDDDATDTLYRGAIGAAVDGGLNVLDTAINYRSQRSERAIGAVLSERIASGTLRREEVFVASKAGYLPFDGSRPKHVPTWLDETYIRTGIIQRDELVSGVHCMSPRYLSDQIDRSRRNLNLATIDLYYLHNPESGMEGLSESEFLRRIRDAFAALEQAVSDGRIGAYGTATWNGYRKAPGTRPHHSLTTFVELAREVGGPDHHFRYAQLPYNLALIEAYSSATQPIEQQPGGALVPFLKAAAHHNLYVMASAPLLQGQLTERLPDEMRPVLGFQSDPQRAVQFVRSTPGVGTTLVGMKQERHVAEMLEVERAKVLPAESVDGLYLE